MNVPVSVLKNVSVSQAMYTGSGGLFMQTNFVVLGLLRL